MGGYAKGTNVSVHQSKDEIYKVLERYGCEDIGDASRQDKGWVVEFWKEGRFARMLVPFPSPDDPGMRTTHNGTRRRTERQIKQAVEQETRRRFRCLLIYLKGKFEYLDSGSSYFEKEFFGHLVDPISKLTMSEMLEEQMRNRYLGHEVEPMICLPGPTK